MKSLKHVVSMIRPNCFMASVDLKDAYYSVPIHRDHQKYLKFEWQGQLYQFTCLPNGLACAPRLFTKLLKPAYSTLRKQGFQSVGYIDDSYLQGITKPECENNVQATTKLFDSLGLYVHPDKSILEPSQVLEFLGFVLNSVSMTVTLSHAKAENIKHVCKDLLTTTQPTIREVAVVIGKLVASFPGVAMIPLFYRQLENEKTAALKFRHGRDAFSVDWGKHYFYAFPPFNLTDRVLQKVEADQASGILIVPQWTTQPWFPVLMRLLVQDPLILPRGKKVLQLPYNPNVIHPLHHKLTLMACKLSGCHYKVKDFQSKLLKSSCHHGENQQRNSTGPTLPDGISFQLNGLVIPCRQL